MSAEELKGQDKTIRQEGDENARKMAPRQDRILVRRLRKDLKVGSIWLPDGGKSLDVVVSEVLAIGPWVRPWEVRPGEFALHVRVVGIQYDGTLGVLGKMSQSKDADYCFLRVADVLAVVPAEAVVEGNAQASEGRTGTWSQGQS